MRGVRDDLLRVVAVEDEPGPTGPCFRLELDLRRVRPGRGVSLHPDLACLDRAERRKAFPRALRVPGPVSAVAVREYLTQDSTTRGTETEAGENRDERSMSTSHR